MHLLACVEEENRPAEMGSYEFNDSPMRSHFVEIDGSRLIGDEKVAEHILVNSWMELVKFEDGEGFNDKEREDYVMFLKSLKGSSFDTMYDELDGFIESILGSIPATPIIKDVEGGVICRLILNTMIHFFQHRYGK